MNDNAMMALGGASKSGLGGLPQRLVQDGLVDEATMMDALQAAKERRIGVVTQLVNSGAANAREIAIAASHEFGVPLLDLDSVSLDLETVKLVSDKLLLKHRVLPLLRRGKRLFLAVADPTNLHAIDEIKFATGLGIEAVVVEDNKLQIAVTKAIEQVDPYFPKVVPIVVVAAVATLIMSAIVIMLSELFSGRALRPVEPLEVEGKKEEEPAE